MCRDVLPRHGFKAHEGEVLSASLSPVPAGAPEAAPLRLITAGKPLALLPVMRMPGHICKAA